jgi:hypothetical protein
MKKLIFTFYLFYASCTGFVSAESIAWNFNTDGNYEGWFDQNNRMTYSVSGGTLNYTISAQADPQWKQTTGLSSLDASKDITFEVVVKRTSGTANAQTQFYINTTLLGSITMANNNDWQTLSFTYTGGTILGQITQLRFDPASGQNGSWQIDSVSAVHAAASGLSLVVFSN